jgi:hypothetical protein
VVHDGVARIAGREKHFHIGPASTRLISELTSVDARSEVRRRCIAD